MRLATPTDFGILDALADGKRNLAANLSPEIKKDRSYINTRLPALEDYGLLNKIGPAPNSGLYEITDKGKRVLEIHQEHQPDSAASFDYETELENLTAD
ncbi:ArsR family transcriptional regulator [Halodesulfurarchaeum sp. HSR-GB]|uniref:ArsR family transcriptional regulator n=1 Tax=Halodesulfurarchaeum sp. HSR-GB TaxID=3074077 RepID=UPI00285F39BD|nr:ArsR family transcriptional regulator [Halodesulfurarchaeum sp. HSR-GB]MDR5657631.1 ArsR family transcriptional regulator [Halodesulfurarchaeum sp. HSR-GB]